ncbi:3-beta hydroxysteroid dehydrogenase [Bradyrhizobium sp. CCBAU 21359]|uniref:NAD-dependent epimerase/dehydratase family protein n=1 Tax=Bradyrhizobium sp. CCBAU 21359 TaxID=1325080 RepID=UPI0023059E27|nr:NAD-dependent epimerase/dehydratase family protein [Bradyrhizobium sp. CCBAU 21359]MDA9453630.1 3-beta hydroxysteroid dehydrogenase [Bradyrhizobium sp. CCBAU 21359]
MEIGGRIAVIFGGHGFIGSHLARELVNSGKYARVVSADIAPQPRFRTKGVEYIFCDVRLPIPADLAPGVTDIYNLAAVHVTPGPEDWEYYWTNVSGALSVTQYARITKAKTLFFTSSISVYGPSEDEISEFSDPNPESSYGKSKLLAEGIHQSWQLEEPRDRKLVIVRPAVVFGFQERGNFTRLARSLEKRAFFYPGRRDTKKACGYVKDLVASLEFAGRSEEMLTVYNFAFDEPLTTEGICAAFCRVANLPEPRFTIPISLILLGGLAFELLSKLGLKTSINRARVLKLFRSTNIVPKKLQDDGFVRQFDLAAALRDWRSQSPAGRFE